MDSNAVYPESEERIKVRIRLEQLESKSSEFEKRIKELEDESEMFCTESSYKKVKVRDVVIELLYVLGYEVQKNLVISEKVEEE